MPSGLLEIDPLQRELASLLEDRLHRVTAIFERQLASELSAVNALCLHVEHYRGKMLRPTLVLVSGLAAKKDAVLSEKHEILAAVVEMIHMATLVHDDILDEATVRRQGDTVNHLWGNETAVMLGDYLISNAFHLCSLAGDPAINLALGKVTNTLCEGELVQLRHRNNLSMDEATYFEIVRRKTGSLIGVCCELGSMLSGADASITDSLRRFGEHLGIAFQIRDDLLDLVGDEQVVGKSLGKDLEKGKFTLPVIHALTTASPRNRQRLFDAIAHRDAYAVSRQLQESGAVEQATKKAEAEVNRARQELATLPAGDIRTLLHRMAEEVISRSA